MEMLEVSRPSDFEPAFKAAARRPSHAMAGKYFLATLAKSGPVLLQALLNRSIIAQLLSAEALRISSAGLLLLWRAHVALRIGQRSLS
jgi:hypothetical protein